ncbi:MAG: RluA family pseudouridine synthase [Solirubrobacterales bacterium]
MREPVRLTVPADAAGRRLDTWLAQALASYSRSELARSIDAGLVKVDGHAVTRSMRLAGGEHVTIRPVEPRSQIPAAAEPRIVFEDASLLVVDKPAGLVVHPARGHRAETLTELLERNADGRWRAHPVHRLDRDTSGLMVVAKEERTRARLALALRKRELEREYLALVAGRPATRSGTIDAPLGRDRVRRTRTSADTAKARRAVTHFEVEQPVGQYTLLRVCLETGRTHQIRAHLAMIDLPVAGDPDYGGRGALELKRQFLHSARLALTHPATGDRLEWRSDLPVDLTEALERARLGEDH